jgi:cytochrome b involved in lipid metabolism
MKKTKLIFIIAIVMAFIFVADVFLLNMFAARNEKNAIASGNINTQNTANNPDLSRSLVALSLDEISKHNSQEDCWLLINNKIYDATSYINSHPGGKSEIIPGCGKDATNLFNTKGNKGSSHSSSANSLLDSFYLGNLNQKVAASEIENKTSSIKNMTLPQTGDDEDEEEDEYEDD